jgi:nucleotide-binding universal stress UspA family protein
VLCSVDFSELSRLALRHAEAIARRANASLTVLYVNDPMLIAAAAAALHDRHIIERSRRELRAFVKATLPRRSAGQTQTCLGSGHPPNEILRIAGRAGADLLVLGTQGLTGTDRLLIGSTTLTVLRRTTVPVLAVPRPGDAAPNMLPPSWPGGRLMAAVELDRMGRQDIETASVIAQWFGASLLLVHVVNAVSAPAWLIADRRAHDRIRLSRAQRQLERLITAARPQVNAETRVVWGQPADELAALAATTDIGLLVMSLKDRRGWFGTRRGSVSYHVLTHAVSPVLAYPPHWRPR